MLHERDHLWPFVRLCTQHWAGSTKRAMAPLLVPPSPPSPWCIVPRDSLPHHHSATGSHRKPHLSRWVLHSQGLWVLVWESCHRKMESWRKGESTWKFQVKSREEIKNSWTKSLVNNSRYDASFGPSEGDEERGMLMWWLLLLWMRRWAFWLQGCWGWQSLAD